MACYPDKGGCSKNKATVEDSHAGKTTTTETLSHSQSPHRDDDRQYTKQPVPFEDVEQPTCLFITTGPGEAESHGHQSRERTKPQEQTGTPTIGRKMPEHGDELQQGGDQDQSDRKVNHNRVKFAKESDHAAFATMVTVIVRLFADRCRVPMLMTLFSLGLVRNEPGNPADILIRVGKKLRATALAAQSNSLTLIGYEDGVVANLFVRSHRTGSVDGSTAVLCPKGQQEQQDTDEQKEDSLQLNRTRTHL